MVPADYKPIATLRLFYKMFAYMLARVEPAVQTHQPQEQHVFGTRHRVEEHLPTANMVLDKLLAVSNPCLDQKFQLFQSVPPGELG